MVPVSNVMGQIAGYSAVCTLGLIFYISYEVVNHIAIATYTYRIDLDLH